MFDDSLPGPDGLADADDAAVVAAVAGWARAEAAAAARRLAAIAELVARRCEPETEAASQYWACDDWDAAAAEIAAALNLGHRSASGQMRQANALRHRLPNVGQLFLNGDIGQREAATIAWRTQLIEDPEVLAKVDEEIVGRATRWGRLSGAKLEQAVDVVVERHDRDAVLRFRGAARGRDVQIGAPDDTAGTASMWGRLFATDAAVLIRRLDAMARHVCADDPRSLGERRSDALGTLGAGGLVLACTCGKPDCAAAVRDPRADAIVIHVLAEQASLEEPGDPGEPDEPPEPPPADDSSNPTTTSASRRQSPGVIAGGGIVPAPLLAALVGLGASIRPLLSADLLRAENGYRPSAALQRFVRNRDLTCRFPGCNHPAERCDVDHATAWPAGATHPSNLRCLCRKHHLLKTFWSGRGGWTDRQRSDGAIVWTSPTGATYLTHPTGSTLFPRWNVDTGEPPMPQKGPPGAAGRGDRGIAMPLRERTRAKQRAQWIRTERGRTDPFRGPPAPF